MLHKGFTLLLSGLLIVFCRAPVIAQIGVPCAVPASDKLWIDKTIDAWRYTAKNIAQIPDTPNVTAILFSSDCMLTSTNALYGNDVPVWIATPIKGVVPLPGGTSVPISVIARSQDDDGKSSFFLMSTPSIWRAANVPGGASFDLETLMTAVMLHEATHVSQGPSYMRAFPKLAEALKLPEDWNDDSLQERFENNKNFTRSVDRETNLLFSVAAEKNDRAARRLAQQARALIMARRAKHYRGKNKDLGKIEDLFLTVEGSGQWVGYRWLIDPRGANVPVSDAIAQFARRSKWWSQKQGLALTLATDRLDKGAWRQTAFGDGADAGIGLLDRALAGR